MEARFRSVRIRVALLVSKSFRNIRRINAPFNI